MAKPKKSERKKAGRRARESSCGGKCASELQSALPAPSSDVATIDRRSGRDRRKGGDRRKIDLPVAVERRKLERRAKVNRRRQIDPTTCERDYNDDEIEFMRALEQYKRSSGRMFPTCSEILEVLRTLGYEKRRPESLLPALNEPIAPSPPPPAPTLPA